MAPANEDFSRAVQNAPIQDPRLPIIGNVTATPLIKASAIREDLQAQLTSRVRWTETIQAMSAAGVTTFIELGSGTVLTGLLKRIDREATGIALGTPSDFEKLSAN
jgi:[acyl-carrier-protein] S-malonyltransferase